VSVWYIGLHYVLQITVSVLYIGLLYVLQITVFKFDIADGFMYFRSQCVSLV
jgi:hypothetical protein